MLLWLSPLGTEAQFKPDYKLIDGTTGLPHPNITQIVQDHKGFMWFATGNGIVRYDGNDYLVFRITDKEPSLSSNHITTLLIDRHNRLWIGTENGVDLMDLQTYKIRNIPLECEKTQPPAADQFIYSFLESSNGTIWISTRNGQLYKSSDGNKANRIYHIAKNEAYPKSILEEDTTDGTMWIRSSYFSVAKLDTASGAIIRQFDFGKNNCNSIYNTHEFGFVVCTHEGLYKYNRSMKRFEPTPVSLPQPKVYSVFNDHKKDLWISQGSDMLYRYSNGTIENFTSVFSSFPSKAYSINCFFEDRLHNLWVGTNRGIVCFHIPDNRFKQYLVNYEKPNSIRAITQTPDGMFYFGGYTLFVRFDPHTSTFTHPLTDTFSNYCLLPDTANILWFITEGRGVSQYNTKTNIVKSYEGWQRQHNWGSFLVSGFRDHDGLLWLGDYENLLRFDPKSQQLHSYTGNFDGINLGGVRALQFYETRDGHLWIACNQGLFELDKNRKPIRHYSEKAPDRYRLSNNHILNILEDTHGLIWIASSYGLNRLNRATGLINTYTTEDGLADNIVVAIQEDNRNRLWVATNNGLSMFDIQTGQFRNYHTEDGLSSNEFNHGAFYKAKDGTLYFGGMNGINVFDPNTFENEYTPTPIFLSRINIVDNDSSVFLFDEQTPYTLRLPYSNRSCQIQFALADYIRSEKNVFAYKLDGIDKNWVSLGHQPFIRFTSLPPGKYTLLIRAAGSNGIWTRTPLKIQIEVEQVFYKQWWFITLGITAMLAIISLVFYMRLQQVKRLSQIRIHIASDLHDEVGSALTRVAMQAELMAADAPSDQAPMLSSIIESCRTAMSNMRDVIWSIDARNDSFADLIDRMNGHIRQMTEGSRFTYSFNYGQAISADKINPNERQNIYLIFKEAINNIIKHSNGNFIRVEFDKTAHQLELIITDNGVFNGFTETDGMGLANMKMRAQKINARFTIDTQHSFQIRLSKKIVS
jgi:ligand-binding sensor domain-containing protein/two-component sensor histidine kinase